MSNYSNMYYFLKNGDLKHITMKLPTRKERRRRKKTPEKRQNPPSHARVEFFSSNLYKLHLYDSHTCIRWVQSQAGDFIYTFLCFSKDICKCGSINKCLQCRSPPQGQSSLAHRPQALCVPMSVPSHDEVHMSTMVEHPISTANAFHGWLHE